MPEYSYKAADTSGKIRSGIRFAGSERELRAYLQELGLFLLSTAEGGRGSIIDTLKSIQPGGMTRGQLIEFCSNSAVMLNAGVPLITALEELGEDSDNRYVGQGIGELCEHMAAGETLHNAMARRPKDFGELFLNLIRIGEETGQLSDIFINLARHYKRMDDLIRNVKKALMYPAFVLIALMLACFVFLTFVFPPLFGMLDQFDVELPLITKVVMGISNSLKEYGGVYLTGMICLGAAFFLMRRFKTTRYWMDWLLIRTPFVNRVFIQLHMTFFLRYMALMLNAGVDILRAIELAANSVSNLAVREKLLTIQGQIMEGAMFSQSLRTINLIPNTVLRMVAVGESSGNLPEQMDYLADIYNEKLERVIAAALALLEPALIFTMAGLALAMVMAVLVPIYNMVSTLSTGMGTGGFK